MKLRQARLCQKKIRVSKNASSAHALVKTQTSPALQKKIRLYFFWHCSCETQASPALQKKSGSKQLFFRHCSCETQASSALPKKALKYCSFRHCSCETQTSPVLQKNNFQALKKCFFGAARVKLRQVRLCKKKALIFFFGTALVKLRQARLCKKNNFQALKKCFSYVSCQICQLHLVTSL